MENISNLSQFKKALQVGTNVLISIHPHPTNPDQSDFIKPARPVSVVQTNSFCIENGGWLTFPKAANCEFSEAGMSIFFEDKINSKPRQKTMTIKIINQ